MLGNEYEDAECPECGCAINEFGFCYDCGFDYEAWLAETEDSFS